MPEVNEQEMSGVDRELSHLLAVEPSPEFAAKVRARIEQQPAREFAWWPWAMTSFAAAAVIVAAIVVSSGKVPPAVSPASVRADIRLPAGEITLQTQVPDHGRRFGRPVARTQRPATRVEPEILLDPSLAAAVRRLVIEQPTLPDVPSAPSLDPVVVEPLKVQDITNAGGAGL